MEAEPVVLNEGTPENGSARPIPSVLWKETSPEEIPETFQGTQRKAVRRIGRSFCTRTR